MNNAKHAKSDAMYSLSDYIYLATGGVPKPKHAKENKNAVTNKAIEDKE